MHYFAFMENRSDIVRELYELRLFLNKANLKANQKTELKFEIRKSIDPKIKNEFVCYLTGASNPIFITLSYQKIAGWKGASLSSFYHLEKICTELLNNKESAESIQKTLTSLGIENK